MKTEFIQPRFTGLRFEEHTLPLDVARDLAAYEVLVVELSKHLFLLEHSERQRVPKGFTAGFNLHLEKVDDGSARPLLALVMAGTLNLVGGEFSYFERARDLISECVASQGATLPAQFPKELLSHFNQVGRSLRADETMELPRAGSAPAVLTPERRKHLVLAADQVYEREVELSGTIAEADWEKSTFRLRLADGNQTTVPMPESFHHRAREYGGRSRHQAIVKGVATFDSWDHLHKFVLVESLEIQNVLAARFDELANLENGWYEGAGYAPDKAQLARVAERFASSYPERLPLPAIVPTQDGNLLLEWNAVSAPTLDIKLSSLAAVYHAFDGQGEDVEREFSLTSESAWQQLFSFLDQNVRALTA